METIDVTIRFPKGQEKAADDFLRWVSTFSDEFMSMIDENFTMSHDIVVNKPQKLITFSRYIDTHEE